jgi:hypothetical protein
MRLAMTSAQDGMVASWQPRSATAEEVNLHCLVERAAYRGAVSIRRLVPAAPARDEVTL